MRTTNPEYDAIGTSLKETGLSMTVINNITDTTMYNCPANRIEPALLQRLCNPSNGSFICLDLNDEASKTQCLQSCLSWLNGEVGYDVPDFPPFQE